MKQHLTIRDMDIIIAMNRKSEWQPGGPILRKSWIANPLKPLTRQSWKAQNPKCKTESGKKPSIEYLWFESSHWWQVDCVGALHTEKKVIHPRWYSNDSPICVYIFACSVSTCTSVQGFKITYILWAIAFSLCWRSYNNGHLAMGFTDSTINHTLRKPLVR